MSAYSGSITPFLYLIFFALTIIIKADPISYTCGTTASDGPYQDSVSNIMSDLYIYVPDYYFNHQNLGDAVGYALCRGDVDIDDCNTCISQAASNILELCLDRNSAFVYYDYCYITYLPLELSDTFVYESDIYFCSHSSIRINDPPLLDHIVTQLFSGIAESAQDENGFFGSQSIDLGDSHVLYGYAQCFYDMLGQDCKACIDELTAQIPDSCTYGYAGGRLVGGTCILRFEFYNFLNW